MEWFIAVFLISAISLSSLILVVLTKSSSSGALIYNKDLCDNRIIYISYCNVLAGEGVTNMEKTLKITEEEATEVAIALIYFSEPEIGMIAKEREFYEEFEVRALYDRINIIKRILSLFPNIIHDGFFPTKHWKNLLALSKENLEKPLKTLEYTPKVYKERDDTNSKSKISLEEIIDLSEFAKLDLRIGKIENAERVQESKKLIKLDLDIGGEMRQLVAGIADEYTPESLIGKLIPILTNLNPAKLMGVESQGMILAVNVKGKPILLHPDKVVPAGSRVL